MRPERREDGRCIDCGKQRAMTTDGRLCLGCLRVRIRKDTPRVRTHEDGPGWYRGLQERAEA